MDKQIKGFNAGVNSINGSLLMKPDATQDADEGQTEKAGGNT